MKWVPWAPRSRPIELTPSRTSYAYFRFEISSRSLDRPCHRYSDRIIRGAFSQSETGLRVPSMISKHNAAAIWSRTEWPRHA